MAELNGSISLNITKEENFQADEENFVFNEQEFASIFTEETYKNKFKEFEIAISKRDHIIQQLTDKLEECVRGKEKTEEELKLKSEEFAKEFENLELQLKECINPLKKTNTIEYETLKSKLNKTELDLSQSKEIIEKLTQELRERKEDQTFTERKYKMLFQAQQSSQQRHLSELKALEETLKMKYKEQIGKLEEEVVEFRQDNEKLREKISKENVNTELQINDLISQLELKNNAIEKLVKENDEIIIENKKSLERLQAELSEKHEKETECVKKTHTSQVKLLAEQIDVVKRKQEADQKEITEALKEAFNEKMKQVRELKEVKDKNAKLLKELEDARLKTADLESKCSLLDLQVGAEKETSEIRLRAVNEALEAKQYLEERIVQLENDVKLSFENQNDKARELANVLKELQEEKESKNEMNLKVKELTLKNESLFTELEAYSQNYTSAKEKLNNYENEIETLKKKLDFINGEKNLFENSQKESKNEISNLSLKLRNLEIEKKCLSDSLSDLQCKYTSDTSSFEAQISKLSQEKLLLEKFLERYKEGYQSLNEKLFKVCHIREIKEDSFSDTELIRDFSMNAEEADPFSLLASRISFLSDKLEETESVASEFHSLLQEKDFYKEEYDKLMTKVKEEENTASIKNDFSENSTSVIHYKECESCHRTISTQDQGFQTSLDQNLCYLPTTRTIEEDYTIEEIEEIYIVPSKVSMKCSVSLKDLKEIGAAENKNELGLSTKSTPADYDQLMAKYHESLLAIKSLKNENTLLRQALKFKQSISVENKGEPNDYIDERKENNLSRKLSSELHNSEKENSKIDSLNESEKSTLSTEEVQEKQTFEPLEKEEMKPISSDLEADKEKNALNSQLQLQINFNETLKEELQMLQLNLTPQCKDWEDHLRKGVDLFIKTQHPYLQRKGSGILDIVDSWKEILKSGGSFDVSDQTTKEKEMETDLKNLLIVLKDHIAEQKEFRKILKDMENNIVACMGNNMDALVQSLITKENSFALMEFDATTLDKMGDSNLMAADDGNDILKEFHDITKSIMDATQEEKMKLFQNQRNILNILEENQSRINEIFKKHFNNLIANSSIEDVKSILKTVAENVDSSLNEESVMIEKMYSELLKQYSHEETLHSQSRALTLNEFKSRLSLHLQQNKGQLVDQLTANNIFYEGNLASYYSSHNSFDMTSESFSNVDLWKRLISALSQVTLNLLHYYTISQKFANDEADNQLLPESLPAAGGYAPHFGPVTSLDDSEEENSLKIDMEGQSVTDECILNVLDSTGASDGMLEDFEKNEQIKEVLITSYPNLTKVLKGNYDQVAFPDLEKEAQEFIISLQASTGMLRIFMLSKADNPMSCLTPWKPSKDENNSVPIEEAKNENIIGENDAQTITLKETHTKQLEFSLTDMTPVKRTFVPDLDTQLEVLRTKLNEEQKDKEEMSKKLHHVEGLYTGLIEEKKLLMNEFKNKEDQINDLVRQLQQTADLLKKAEEDLKGNENSKAKKSWHQKERSIKEKVKAVLSARDKESLNQRELVERVRDLEVVLEETVTERDKSLEAFSMKIHDLSQQLDTADRQLRANKQFFEVQAAERDQEMDELIKANEKLRNELKERESLISQHHGLQKEVQMLEKELKENYTSLEEKETEIDEKQNDLSSALQKIRDLKQDIDSLEQQLSTKCSENENLLRRFQNLEEELKETTEKNTRLQHELEILSQKIQFNPSSRQNTNLLCSEDDLNHNQNHSRPSLVKQVSISEEIENSTRDLQCQTSLEEYENINALPAETRNEVIQKNDTAVPDASLFEDLLDRLEKSTVGLESLQFTMMTGSGASDEELSVREHLQWSETPCIRKTRSLSPSSLEAKLEEKFLAFERSAEAAAKYAKDLEMRYCNLKAEYDEVINERDDLNERLSVLSSIKSELDKASHESELLRQDFDKKVQALKNQLSSSKIKESELKSDYKSLQSKVILKEEELRSTIIREREQFENDASAFKKEKAELEKTIKEYFEEKETYRKQNSEQLIKISCLEARLEDLKRSESPHEYELKTKINSLKEDLEKCREELTLKFREVETLRYCVKELKDQLIIREEQIDNLSQHKECQSLPPPSKKENRELTHALEGLEAQKKVNEQLMEKLQKMKKEMNDSSSLSDGLISLIINEKEATIKEISQERKRLINLLQDVLGNLQNRRPNREIIKMVKENLKISEKCTSASDSTNEEHEIQRGFSTQTISEINFKSVDENDEFVSHIPDLRKDLSSSDDGKGRLSNYPLENFKLESVHPIKNANEFGKGRSKTQAADDKKLEADFEVAQEMLESKEEELESMAAEVEDCVAMPPQNFVQTNEIIFENENLRKTVEGLQSQLQAQQTSLEKLQEYENTSVELRKTLDDNSRKNEELVNTKENLEHKISYLESQLEEKQNRIEKLKQDLELRNKEIADLSTQVGQILTQFKDSNTKYKKQINNLERDHFREMQDMKDKNIEREKQLCNEYEERLSSQVGELTLKLSREKDEALKNYQNHYEELLSKATKQKQNKQKVREEKSKNISEETQKEMQRKLEMAVGLDESFMSYLEKGVILSRESSVASEGKDGRGSIPDEDRNICSRRLQSLIRKINLEGIQVLTLSEKLFLQSHQEILQDSLPTHQNPPILLDKENEMRVKELENKLKVAIYVREEYRGMVHRVGQDADDLRKRLSEEMSEASQNCDKIYQDLRSSRESVKVYESQISELEAALSEERINFRMISSTLDNERILAASSNEHQNNIIKDLRNSLEKERNRTLALMNEVHELKMSKYQFDSTTESLSTSITEIFNERDRKFMEEREMHRKIDNLQLKLSTANFEKNCLKRDLELNLSQREQLELVLKEVESKKRSMDIELQNKDAIIKELSRKVKLLESELCEWKESRMRKLLQQKQDENEIQFRWSNEDVKKIGRKDHFSSEKVCTFNLKELKKKDIEIEALQEKIFSLEKDLKLQKEKLESVNSENLEPNNAGLQIKDVGKFLEIQHRENVELCKSVLKLIDEGHVLRQKNLKLEEVIDELKTNHAIRERSLNLKDEHILIAEKTALAAEVSALKLALKQCETKNENLTKQINTQEINNDTHQLGLALKKEGISVRYLQWKFNRCESYRRALVWQKSYLIHMLNFYQMKTKKLTSLTQRNAQVAVDYLEKYQQTNIELTPLSKFRSAALVVVALSRMKFIMNKWELGRKLEAAHNRSPSPGICSVDSSPLIGIPRHRSPHTLDVVSPFHITGLTPPTKDVPPPRIKAPTVESRNLFGCRKDEKDDIDEYIKRLEYIHTQLGLSSHITKPGTKDS